MIGRLRGVLLDKRPPWLVVDVNGVGYELEAPMSTFYVLGQHGDRVELYTHLAVREDALNLFGFASETERWLFRNLIRVNKVGARLALAILSGMSVDGFTRCVSSNDVDALVKLPGVGRKTAERLLVEMRDRLDGVDINGATTATPAAGGTSRPASARDEARDALLALGYKPAEVGRLLDKVDSEGLDSEQIIRQALRAAMPGQ